MRWRRVSTRQLALEGNTGCLCERKNLPRSRNLQLENSNYAFSNAFAGFVYGEASTSVKTRAHTHTAERRRNCILVEKFNVFLFHFPELSALFAWERIRQVKRRHSIWSVCMCDSRHSRSVLMCSKLYIYSWLLSIIVLAAKWRLSWKLLLLISSFSRSIFSVINSFFVSSHLASSFTFRAREAEFVRKYLVEFRI